MDIGNKLAVTSGKKTEGRGKVGEQLPTAAAAAAKSLQSCSTLYDPVDGSMTGQASPSLGFSRQEHRSGLSFSSPMHESEK